MRQSFAVAIGGAAGQGVATPGDIFAKIFSRRGLHLNAYNAYQSIIRGGHTFLTVRAGPDPITNMGDRLDLLIPLNQDTMDRHLGLLALAPPASTTPTRFTSAPLPRASSSVPSPYSKLADITRNKVAPKHPRHGGRAQHDGRRLSRSRKRHRRAVRKKERQSSTRT